MRRIVTSPKILPGGSSHFSAPEAPVTPAARREYVRAVRPRYTLAPQDAKRAILDEFCATTGFHRKYAIALLNHPRPDPRCPRRRRPVYGAQTVAVLAAIWEAAGIRGRRACTRCCRCGSREPTATSPSRERRSENCARSAAGCMGAPSRGRSSNITFRSAPSTGTSRPRGLRRWTWSPIPVIGRMATSSSP